MPHHTQGLGRDHTRPASTDTTSAIQKKPSAAPFSPADSAVDAPPTLYSSHEAFLDHLDRHPEDHFLAPIHMYECEDWASDSDDDAEDLEWDAGITDFALFDSDRRHAEESNKPLPSKWNDLLDKQTSALRRALERRRAIPNQPESDGQTLGVEDLPSLTPDDSPSLRDDLDVESYHGQSEPRPSVPNYLTISVTPPDGEQRDVASEYEPQRVVFDLATETPKPASHAKRKQQRPGLSHSRTLSGQEHAWRRPSMDMYTVGEEPDNERREELIDSCSEKGGEEEESRGRGRGKR